MMIHINLLPVRQVKKREVGRQVLVVIGGILAVALIGNWLWYDARASEQTKNAQRLAATQARIAELEKVIGEVNNINARKKDVQAKLTILNDLRKQRTGPVRMLDALATATPKKVWLTKFEEKQNAVVLDGKAASVDDVSEFMRGLQTMVWTPKGMGRLVEQKRDTQTSRVELLSAEGAIEDFPSKDVAPFFSNIQLKKAEQRDAKDVLGTTKLVEFELNLNSNYTI
jgi:type IV pilus assembly protein PilN